MALNFLAGDVVTDREGWVYLVCDTQPGQVQLVSLAGPFVTFDTHYAFWYADSYLEGYELAFEEHNLIPPYQPPKANSKCSCDLYTQILPYGCKCNGT